MKPGEEFEIECVEYLETMFKQASFEHQGGMDSTMSDIAVVKNDKTVFFVEAKDGAAQSGQFVLFPDEQNKKFLFSTQNRSEQNVMTDYIIEYMNENFDTFFAPGTTGKTLNIDSGVFAEWIIEHYKNRGVRYVISRKNDFVILPIEKFAQYFDISAKYRIKKSGSNPPAKKYFETIKQEIQNTYKHAEIWTEEKKLYVKLNSPISQSRFEIGEYTYYLSEKNNGVYEVRCLSNTNNKNVIFSIKIKKEQETEDLEQFISDLN